MTITIGLFLALCLLSGCVGAGLVVAELVNDCCSTPDERAALRALIEGTTEPAL